MDAKRAKRNKLQRSSTASKLFKHHQATQGYKKKRYHYRIIMEDENWYEAEKRLNTNKQATTRTKPELHPLKQKI